MLLLLLKLVLTPLIVGAVTLIGRRWGHRVAGLVVGLPLTTGPVAASLGGARGRAWGAGGAPGAVVGLMGAAVFCATYATVARRRSWPVALAAGVAAIAVLTVAEGALDVAALPLALLVVLAVSVMILVWVALAPRVGGPARVPAVRPAVAPARWDLPARMAVSTTMVAAVTAAAPALGSGLSGVLSALPLISGVLGVCTHRSEGAAAAGALLRGTAVGCIASVLFVALVGALAAPGRLVATYAEATLLSVVTGAIVTHLTRPRIPAHAAPVAPSLRRAA